jgi:hypothetical protein
MVLILIHMCYMQIMERVGWKLGQWSELALGLGVRHLMVQ